MQSFFDFPNGDCREETSEEQKQQHEACKPTCSYSNFNPRREIVELAPRQKRVQIARNDDDISLKPHANIDEQRNDNKDRDCPPFPDGKNNQRDNEAKGEHDPEHQREATDKTLKDDAHFSRLVKVNGQKVLNKHGVEPKTSECKQESSDPVKMPIGNPLPKPKVFANSSHDDNDSCNPAKNCTQDKERWQNGRVPTGLESDGKNEGNIGVNGNHDDEEHDAHDGHNSVQDSPLPFCASPTHRQNFVKPMLEGMDIFEPVSGKGYVRNKRKVEVKQTGCQVS